MKAWCMWFVLAFASPLFAGGAIGGSTGAKCHEYVWINADEFQQLVQEALSNQALVIDGERMHLESLDLMERTIEVRSRFDDEYTIVIRVYYRD